MEPAGFREMALCPSYGMAEAGVAVSMTSPQEMWSSTDLKLGDSGTIVGSGASIPSTVVSAGEALSGYAVTTGESDVSGAAELLVSGPSLCRSYSDGSDALDSAGRFHTSDLGVVEDGQVYVLGRKDDVFIAAGRKIYACDIDDTLSKIPGVRAGRSVAVKDAGNGLVVAAEVVEANLGRDESYRLKREIRRLVTERVGIAPRQVCLLRRNSLPMTSSGKVRRRALASLLGSDWIVRNSAVGSS